MEEGFKVPENDKKEQRLATVQLLVEWLANFHVSAYSHLQKMGMKEEPCPAFLNNPLPYPDEAWLSSLSGNTEKMLKLREFINSDTFHSHWDLVFCPRTSQFSTICHGNPSPENSMVWQNEDGKVTEATFSGFQDAR